MKRERRKVIREQVMIESQLRNLFIDTRIKNDLNQIEFAKRLGVSQGTISKIECGKATVSSYAYIKILREFELEGL